MIKKTKWKITILLYVIFITAFIAILFIFYTAHRESNRSEISRQLSHYARNVKLRFSYYGEDRNVITESALKEQNQTLQLSEIYVVRKDPKEQMVVLEKGNDSKLSEQEILTVAENILKENVKKGYFEHFQYRLSKDGENLLIVFTNISFFENQQKHMLFFLCMICLISFVIWAFVSYGISGWLVKPMENALEKQNEFISAAGHELKTPLSIMKASLEMLKSQIEDNKYLDYMIAENEKMDALVQEMLSLSKLEFQKKSKKLEVINLSSCIEGSALPFEVIAYERGIFMKIQIEKDIFIYGKEKDIQQLTAILLDNAVRHTNPKAKTMVSLERKKEKAFFIVRNQGKEIPVEEREKIFEQFYRGDKARSRGEGRYGLGLSIARNIAQLYGTKIQVECENGWTSFYIKFEIAKK